VSKPRASEVENAVKKPKRSSGNDEITAELILA
jgi:hypothetical protein